MTAGDLTAAMLAHGDDVHDFARRQGCSTQAAPEAVEAGALEVVAVAADTPAELPELLGHWFAAVWRRVPIAPAEPVVGSGPLAHEPEQELLTAGLAARPPVARAALLLSDAYDLPPAAVAAALQEPPDDALTLVGRARLALLPDVYATDEPLPAGHGDEPALARLAGGAARRSDAGTARHVRGCAACAADVQAQQDVRRLLGGLSVVALPEACREELLERIAVRARSLLPAEPVGPVAGPALGRLLTPAPMALSLLLAGLVGVGVGAVLSRPRPVAQAQARALPPVVAPVATPLPGDLPHAPDPAPSTLVFTYPPLAPVRVPRTAAPPAPPPSSTPPPSAAPVAIVLSPATGPAGSPIRVNGTGWPPGAVVRLVLLDPAGRPTGSAARATAGPAGRFQASLPAGPADAAPGTYLVEATAGGVTTTAAFVVR